MASWKDVVRNVAPALGTALGGPAVGTALKFVSQALLGKPDASEQEIAARVANWTAQDELALRQAEQQFTLSLLDKAIASDQVDAADRASARQREVAAKDSATPRALAIVVMALFGFVVAMVVTGHAAGLKDPVVTVTLGTLIGYVSAKADTVVNYYFGSSSGSAAKQAALERLAEAKK